MKKTIPIFILLISVSFCCQSQDELDLKIQYQPQTNYHETIERRQSTETSYTGSDEVMIKLRNEGVDNPALSDLHFKRELILKSDSLIRGDTFPLTIEIIEESRDDGQSITPPGTFIYGRDWPGRMPVLDSIYSHGEESSFKGDILWSLRGTFSEMVLPEKTLRIGESFTTEERVRKRMAGALIEYSVITSYRLVSIQDSVADFDISKEYILRTDPMQYSIKLTGSGTGEMKYNIAYSFCETLQVDQEVQVNLQMENYGAESKTTDFYSRNTEISKQ